MVQIVSSHRSRVAALCALCLSFSATGSLFAQKDAEPLELRFDRPLVQFIATPDLPVGPLRGVPGTPFDIQIVYPGPNPPTATQQDIFDEAEAAWEARIQRYADNVVLGPIVISADAPPIDGPGGILGSAGPTLYSNQEGFSISTAGEMNFDSADLGTLEMNGSLGAVIEHEMGHVLGIGTLWGFDQNSWYSFGSGEYTGPSGVAEWNSEFTQVRVPGDVDVELEGGGGTANGHWNENNGGAGLVGITDSMGRDMRDALMTGWLNSGPNLFYSTLTHEHLEDMGYVTFPYGADSLFQDGFESGDTTAWD